MNNHVRILLVDDHTLFRESLVRLLNSESELQVVAHCATLTDAQQILASSPIDIVLLDYDLGSEVGTDLLRHMRAENNRARVLMVTAGMRASSIFNALNDGVAGIILKHSDPRLLIEALRRVASGETWWDVGIVQSLSSNGTDLPSAGGSVRSLTNRQHQVLRGILDGLTNKEIAARMQSSETAIKATIQELFAKAGVRTRSQLVRIAIEKYASEWLQDEA
jgi:two-component system, NarL family, nitrate/nitrite response regulator NarL